MIRLGGVGVVFYFLFHFSYAVKNNNNNPDLSRLRESASTDGNLDLSLSVGISGQTHEHGQPIEPTQGVSGKMFDMRTKEYKEFKKKFPEIDLRTERQKLNQEYQTRYKLETISRLTKPEYDKKRSKKLKSKKESRQRRIELVGFGYGLQGEINKLKMKKVKQDGILSETDSERLIQLRKQNADRVTQNRRDRKLKLGNVKSNVKKEKQTR